MRLMRGEATGPGCLGLLNNTTQCEKAKLSWCSLELHSPTFAVSEQRKASGKGDGKPISLHGDSRRQRGDGFLVADRVLDLAAKAGHIGWKIVWENDLGDLKFLPQHGCQVVISFNPLLVQGFESREVADSK